MSQWYEEARQAIQSLYSDADLFADLLAATSPRKQVKANWLLADRLYKAVKAGETLPMRGVLPCHSGNIQRAINRLPLSGKKVHAFSENLKGNLDAITIDIWVLRYYGIKKASLSGKAYNDLADKIRVDSESAGLKPAEYQAKIWTISRKNAGKKFASFESVSEYRQGKLF